MACEKILKLENVFDYYKKSKTIIEYEMELSDTMAMRCKIGVPELKTKEYIDLISKPTDR